ncbi:Hemin transporter [Sphingomonas antarctica]
MQVGKIRSMAGALVSLVAPVAAEAQERLNQADPSIIERGLPQTRPKMPLALPSATPSANLVTDTAPAGPPRIANAIVVDGAPLISRAVFSDAILPFIGRNLATRDLTELSRAVANVARSQGYPFASASIEAQVMAGGLLRVHLDAGSLSAVRVIGAINPVADHLLTRALVNGSPVRIDQLQGAILLVGDLPGVTVKDSKYIRQDGFGILLVTIAQDPLSAYAQIDNRGSKEVGPVRSTALINARGVFGAGDELGLIVAQTPLQLSEFGFIRARYSAPLGYNGTILSASASFGRTHPGASLAALDVIGKSVDAAVNLTTPILRTRRRSLWGQLEFRGLRSDQTLLASELRNDRLATLKASLNGLVAIGDSTLRAELRATTGLPLHGVTHEGALRSSRSDGDARFVTFGFDGDWTMPLIGNLSLALAAEGQVATRPLLATAEIGAGGPVFGRGYDYAERTGDDGILGSGEVRYDAGRVVRGVIDRLQLYTSVDGGYVTNLRGGLGGGALVSTAFGLRAGHGKLSGMLEAGLPLNKDRFDTGNREPRVTFRLSRIF